MDKYHNEIARKHLDISLEISGTLALISLQTVEMK